MIIRICDLCGQYVDGNWRKINISGPCNTIPTYDGVPAEGYLDNVDACECCTKAILDTIYKLREGRHGSDDLHR